MNYGWSHLIARFLHQTGMDQIPDNVYITGRTQTRKRRSCELSIPRLPKTVPLAAQFSDPKPNPFEAALIRAGENSIREHVKFE